MYFKLKKIVVSFILLSVIVFSFGCDIRQKIDKLQKDGSADSILALSHIATTHESAFIRISAIYALSEIDSIDIVDEVLLAYQEITPFLSSNYDAIIKDYLRRTGMYSVDIENIEYAMREACMDAVFKKFVKRYGFFSTNTVERIKPVYKPRNLEYKGKVVDFLFSVMTSNMPVIYDGGKGIRYRAAYLLQILDVRYVIPEMYQLLLEALDTETKYELAELIMKYGDIEYFPLTDENKKKLLSLREELRILGKDKAEE